MDSSAMNLLSATHQPLAFNGVDGVSGDFLDTHSDLTNLARRIQRQPLASSAGPRPRDAAVAQGLKHGLDPRRLDQAGWGVLFAPRADPKLQEALQPLLRHRQAQVGTQHPDRFRILSGPDGYRPGESKLRFLARHRVGSGPVDPDRLPYYLMLVGEPDDIPYTFQFQLDVAYAVGRLCFDSLEEYASYAESVVATEGRADEPAKRSAMFGVRRDGDLATEMCHDLLVEPLAEHLRQAVPSWELSTDLGPQATKQRLGELLGGDATPSLLLTACHGLGFQQPEAQQRAQQGALVCQEWDGPKSFKRQPKPFFAAEDVTDEARLQGLIAFTFACYSAGTPQLNHFVHRGEHEAEQLAERSFVARLPQRLLGHPRGGALAVVGHVDRAWTYSFDWPLAGSQFETFASTFRRLLSGHPLGSAMEPFNQRYAELECDLADLQARLDLGAKADLLTLGDLWTARNDARNFVILGDPAVRLAPSSDLPADRHI